MGIGEAPVSGDVVYGWSSWRYVVAAAALGIVAAVIGWLLASLLFAVLVGRPSNPVIPKRVARDPVRNSRPEGRPGRVKASGVTDDSSEQGLSGAVYVALYAIFFAVFSLLLARSRPPGLRFGGEGIELAAERRDVLVVPYDAVSSVRVRWFWPVAMLEVFVGSADEPRVMRLDRDGRRPLRKRKGDQLRFSMPIAGLRSSAADIRSQLRCRGLGE